MGSMYCTSCMQPLKSWIRLQYHMATEHKVNNDFRKLNITPSDYSKEWTAQREPLLDKLKDEAKKLSY